MLSKKLRTQIANLKKALNAGNGNRAQAAVSQLALDVARTSGAMRKGEAEVGIAENTTLKKHQITPKLIMAKSIGTDSKGRLVAIRKMDPVEAELKRWNDDLYIMSKAMRVPVTSLKMYRRFKNTEMAKAMYSSTGYGGDWIPTQLSSEIMDRVTLELNIVEKIPHKDMPTNPYDMGYVAGGASVYKTPETQADSESATRITSTRVTTGKRTLTAVKIAARIEMSTELEEDAIEAELPAIKNDLAVALKEGMENGIINGDTAGTHQDTNVTGSTDVRKCYLGWRAQAVDNSDTATLSTFNAVTLRALRKAMGKYGVRPSQLMWLFGPQSYITLLSIKDDSNNPVVITRDKYGDQATVLTGELGQFDGAPVLVSEFCQENLNAAGYYDGTTTTKAAPLCVYTPGYIVGDRRKVTLEMEKDIIWDIHRMVVTQRKAFQTRLATTESTVALGVNMTP